MTNGEIDDPFMQFLASGGAGNGQREPSQDVNRILNQVNKKKINNVLIF